MAVPKRQISLVLGSGGARGHAHIGVIRALEERNLEISYIAGCSMGAVIGGIYAARELDSYFDWAQQLRKRDVIRLLDFSFTMTSLFKGERIIDALKELTGERKIEDLDLGFTAVATALQEEREIWINRGSLFTAIKASMAVPTVFSPVVIDGRLLVDGGLVNPIPIAPTLNDSTDLTVAVNLSGVSEHYKSMEVVDDEAENDSDEQSGYRAAITEFIGKLMPDEQGDKNEPGVIDLLTQSFDVMQGSIARLKLAAYTPDIVVEIPRDACTFFEFYRAQEMAELGYEKTCKVLDQNNL